ncbi:MAG: hypothetical protein C5B49_05110 [Bdellovibrio sp.]|nr:MAG: hypothetical protein C5B49_05110 [Bdellovibrio sp.]
MADFMLKIEKESTMPRIKAAQLIDMLMETLEVSQHKIARLLDVDPHTLSNNRTEWIETLTPKTKKKLLSLYEVVRELGTLKSEALLDVLQRHVFEDENGRKDSVVSAIQADKYSFDTLRQIAALARETQHQHHLSQYPDVSDAIPAFT